MPNQFGYNPMHEAQRQRRFQGQQNRLARYEQQATRKSMEQQAADQLGLQYFKAGLSESAGERALEATRLEQTGISERETSRLDAQIAENQAQRGFKREMGELSRGYNVEDQARADEAALIRMRMQAGLTPEQIERANRKDAAAKTQARIDKIERANLTRGRYEQLQVPDYRTLFEQNLATLTGEYATTVQPPAAPLAPRSTAPGIPAIPSMAPPAVSRIQPGGQPYAQVTQMPSGAAPAGDQLQAEKQRLIDEINASDAPEYMKEAARSKVGRIQRGPNTEMMIQSAYSELDKLSGFRGQATESRVANVQNTLTAIQNQMIQEPGSFTPEQQAEFATIQANAARLAMDPSGLGDVEAQAQAFMKKGAARSTAARDEQRAMSIIEGVTDAKGNVRKSRPTREDLKNPYILGEIENYATDSEWFADSLAESEGAGEYLSDEAAKEMTKWAAGAETDSPLGDWFEKVGYSLSRGKYSDIPALEGYNKKTQKVMAEAMIRNAVEHFGGTVAGDMVKEDAVAPVAEAAEAVSAPVSDLDAMIQSAEAALADPAFLGDRADQRANVQLFIDLAKSDNPAQVEYATQSLKQYDNAYGFSQAAGVPAPSDIPEAVDATEQWISGARAFLSATEPSGVYDPVAAGNAWSQLWNDLPGKAGLHLASAISDIAGLSVEALTGGNSDEIDRVGRELLSNAEKSAPLRNMLKMKIEGMVSAQKAIANATGMTGSNVEKVETLRRLMGTIAEPEARQLVEDEIDKLEGKHLTPGTEMADVSKELGTPQHKMFVDANVLAQSGDTPRAMKMMRDIQNKFPGTAVAQAASQSAEMLSQSFQATGGEYTPQRDLSMQMRDKETGGAYDRSVSGAPVRSGVPVDPGVVEPLNEADEIYPARPAARPEGLPSLSEPEPEAPTRAERDDNRNVGFEMPGVGYREEDPRVSRIGRQPSQEVQSLIQEGKKMADRNMRTKYLSGRANTYLRQAIDTKAAGGDPTEYYEVIRLLGEEGIYPGGKARGTIPPEGPQRYTGPDMAIPVEREQPTRQEVTTPPESRTAPQGQSKWTESLPMLQDTEESVNSAMLRDAFVLSNDLRTSNPGTSHRIRLLISRYEQADPQEKGQLMKELEQEVKDARGAREEHQMRVKQHGMGY